MPRTSALVTVLFASAFLTSTSCRAQTTAENAGPKLLFAQGTGGLSNADQAQIFEMVGLVVDSTGKGFVDETCGQPASTAVSFSDWNHDSTPEVLVISGNTCTSGMAGSSAVLFIKDSAGTYQPNLGFPAASADPQSTLNLGYPDLLIGGPGFCFPIWRWNGTEYEYLRNEPQMAGGCDNQG